MCQQECINAEGRYFCGCYYGYEFGPDGHDCVGQHHYTNYQLVFSTITHIALVFDAQGINR